MRIRFSKREKGQATIEFLGVIPIAMIAIVLIAYAGAQVYLKASSQNFAYSTCMWVARQRQMEGYRINIDAYGKALGSTKSWWMTEFVSNSTAGEDNSRANGGVACGSMLSGSKVSATQFLSRNFNGVTTNGYMPFSPFISCDDNPLSCK
jgi:Flp pilus assembly pilin Flp